SFALSDESCRPNGHSLNHLSSFELLDVVEPVSFADQFAALNIDNALDLPSVHGGDISLLADGKRVGHGLS
ncbi:hypothetical protein, partial [Acinetobacter baumannii]|uniref:hypothetical protein n=1 Tax=Acinetobacter baumannii TaxID=470 RepID=UPI0022283305